MASFTEFLGSLDADAGQRGKQFEHFVKWFLKNDPEWSTQVEQVWLWDEYPQSWGRDCGIDLVFKHKNGENWAVQAKCYAPTTSITKADVDSFISESNRDGIDKRLLIATTDLIGTNAKQVCDAQDKSVTRFLLSHFEDAGIEYPATLDDLSKAKRKEKPNPRQHQVEAIEAVTTKFNNVDRGQLIMACGTGKTFTTLWIKERLDADSTLVLLPSLGLLSQTLHEWTLAANEEFLVLCVCSDESVGKKGSDDAVHSIADLAFPVTSNVSAIKAFLSASGKKVIFSTYQSSPLVAEAQSDKTVPDFDLAIADEAHRCAGKVSGDFSTILNGEKIRAKKRLFTTATPRTYSSGVKTAAEDRGVEVVGMDDEVVFGRQLFTLNFGEAIKRGLLTDYRVVIIGVDDPTILAWIANRELLKAGTEIEMDAESLASQVGLLKAIKDYDLHRLISFHNRVGRAEDFSRDIHKVLGWIDERHKPSGAFQADFVSGDMPTDKRRRKLAQLKHLKGDQRGLLTNAKCLSEGVDVPSLDGVAFIDPRRSQIDIIQATGRAIRLSANKQVGTIILPVFIDKSYDPKQSLESGNFKPIWDVLNALKAHDDVLAEELNQIRTALGRKGGGKVAPNAFSKIAVDLPIGIDHSFAEELRTLLVDQVTASWEFWYGLLERYTAEIGDAFVTTSYITKEGHKLGAWVSSQRKIQQEIGESRRVKLETLTGWVWDASDAKWEEGFRHLQKYIIEFGDANVNARYVSPDDYKLGVWVSGQRDSRATLSSERKNRLHQLNGWSWSPVDDLWNYGYKHLCQYSSVHGNLKVKKGYICEDGFKLSDWIGSQRKKRDSLSEERITKLENIKGWSWSPIDELWEEGFSKLQTYVAQHGHGNVPRSYKSDDGFNLAAWVGTQRWKRDTMPLERIERLERTTEWTWDPNKDAWEIGYQHLLNFVDLNGHSRVQQKFVNQDGYKLGTWVGYQRTNKDKLFPDLKKRLEGLAGWSWNLYGDIHWFEYYELLKEFCSANQTAKVSWVYMTPNGYPLGKWVDRQKKSKSNLSEEKFKMLEALPNWFWADSDASL